MVYEHVWKMYNRSLTWIVNIVVGLPLEMKQKRWTQQSILRIDPHLIPSPHLKCFLSRTAFVIYSFLFILKDSSLIKSPRLSLSLRQRAVPLSTMLGVWIGGQWFAWDIGIRIWAHLCTVARFTVISLLLCENSNLNSNSSIFLFLYTEFFFSRSNVWYKFFKILLNQNFWICNFLILFY